MPTNTNKWNKDNLILFKFTASKNSKLPEAIKKAAEADGVSTSVYIKNTVIEKLQFDGYLSENPTYSGPHGRIVKPE